MAQVVFSGQSPRRTMMVFLDLVRERNESN